MCVPACEELSPRGQNCHSGGPARISQWQHQATLVKYTADEFDQRILYEYLAEASVVFPKVFPVVHNLLDFKINTLLSQCQDPNLLNPIHGIVQSVVYHEESPPQYQTSYLQSFGFNGLWRFAGPFSKQTQIPDYAELIVKFLDALIDTYLPGIDEETSKESLLTPTSPYPPAVQSQLSITANLNLSNSMTSLATSQHSPGQSAIVFHWLMSRVEPLKVLYGDCRLQVSSGTGSDATLVVLGGLLGKMLPCGLSLNGPTVLRMISPSPFC
ncbi:UNVERIFIED_CONTAM: Neurofibromin 1 [Gekko kuhli]